MKMVSITTKIIKALRARRLLLTHWRNGFGRVRLGGAAGSEVVVVLMA
jgi:hypothetical protein